MPSRGRATHPDYHRAYELKRKYGITVAEYEEQLTQQNGKCYICKRPCATGKRLAVDHDHHTNRIRGLLCYRCNRFLISHNDDPEILQRVFDYLSDPPWPGEKYVPEGRMLLRERDQCVHGHPFTPENTILNSQNTRVCRTCKRETDKRGKRRRKG